MAFLIGGANSAADTGFSIANSCRFNKADEAYVHKTPSAGNLDRWTYSMWFKRSGLGVDTPLFGASPAASNNFMNLTIRSSDDMDWSQYSYDSSAYEGRLLTNRKFRDPAAWYHLVAVWDSANGTAGNRMRIYINGVEETSFATDTNPSSGRDSLVNSAIPQTVAADGTGSEFDGYLAEVYFIDGTAYAASDFGEFNEDSPTIWQPKDASGLTFGTNGFYLDFEASDNLGNDANGGTDLTEVNLAATDQSTDSPTNNFAVMNPLDNKWGAATFTEGNLKIVTASANLAYNTSTIALTSGKWYAEVKTVGTAQDPQVGIAGRNVTDNNAQLGYFDDNFAYMHDGQKQTGASASSYGTAYGTDGDIIGIFLDLDNNKLYTADNGTINNSGTGISITAPGSVTAGAYFFAGGDVNGSASMTFHWNFGNPIDSLSSAVADANGYGSFEFDPSDGGSSSFDGAAKDFLAICTKNLGSDGG